MQDKKNILLKLDALAECYDKKLSEEAKILYLNILSQFDDSQIFKAIGKAAFECKFFPRPAELIEFINGPKKSAKDNALIAWDEMQKAVAKYGSWKSVQFADTTIMSVIRAMGGWQQVCMWELDDLNWKMKEFCELYNALQGRDAPSHLSGGFERGQIASGYRPEEPVFIGDKSKALPTPQQKTDTEILGEIANRLKR